MKEIAILGATASGKTSLAIEIAKEVDANILSLDSLSIYKDVDIVAAKPTLQEREGVLHIGIDEIYMDEPFDVTSFFKLYQKAKDLSKKQNRHLIIVGGTSFYLKSMIDGLSPKLEVSQQNRTKITTTLLDIAHAYEYIVKLDAIYANNITPTDRYRIEKWYEIYYESGKSATEFFIKNPKQKIIENLPIFDIEIEREVLRERIEQRTVSMLKDGVIEEVFYLEKKYSRKPQAMGAIGIKETLSYLDGKIDKKQLKELITTHTNQLAKRQTTFNRSQFPQRIHLLKNDLKNKIRQYFN